MFLATRKAGDDSEEAVPRPDPRRLIAEQSVSGAVIAGLAGTIVLCGLWVAVTVAANRVFPWFSILQGAAIGMLVRRFGRGFDFRFPLIAAVISCAGALAGNLVIALPETSEQLGASALQVLHGLTWWTFETFFAEVITAVDYIYAGFGAVLAAFYARRPLDRHEVFALRNMNGGFGRGAGE